MGVAIIIITLTISGNEHNMDKNNGVKETINGCTNQSSTDYCYADIL